MEGNAYKVKAKEPSKGAVIFMHGLGDSGEGWSQVIFLLYPTFRSKIALLLHYFLLLYPAMRRNNQAISEMNAQ